MPLVVSNFYRQSDAARRTPAVVLVSGAPVALRSLWPGRRAGERLVSATHQRLPGHSPPLPGPVSCIIGPSAPLHAADLLVHLSQRKATGPRVAFRACSILFYFTLLDSLVSKAPHAVHLGPKSKEINRNASTSTGGVGRRSGLEMGSLPFPLCAHPTIQST